MEEAGETPHGAQGIPVPVLRTHDASTTTAIQVSRDADEEATDMANAAHDHEDVRPRDSLLLSRCDRAEGAPVVAVVQAVTDHDALVVVVENEGEAVVEKVVVVAAVVVVAG